MTIIERIEQAATWETDQDKLIAIIYEMGKEAAAREICDEHNRRIKAMRGAADAHPYRHLCNGIVDAGKGPQGDIIYTPHYAGDVHQTWGDDQWADWID